MYIVKRKIWYVFSRTGDVHVYLMLKQVEKINDRLEKALKQKTSHIKQR